MQHQFLNPRQSLNKAFLKLKPNRLEIENFKTHLEHLLDGINETESEEFHKNLLGDFLKKTAFDPNHYINTKGRNDLVIHNGAKPASTVGVIIEAKKPTNKTEMPQSTDADGATAKINTKALQELLLYYLRERIIQKNIALKYLIATNISEWFIFDAGLFEKYFTRNKALVDRFNDFENGSLGSKTTDFFYKEIAEPAIAEVESQLQYTWFNIHTYEKPLRNTNLKDDNKLIALFKILTPQHLLKLPFANDSNSLDLTFYTELLHIIGLNEIKTGGKKLIGRKKADARNPGALIESTIVQLDSLDKIVRLEKPYRYGATMEERLFNIAIELIISWVNRILFLKLLEAQLIKYHKGNRAYAFLNSEKIKNFDELNSLFFSVLARKLSQRDEATNKTFAHVPYLNSSLFEPAELEHACLFISQIKDGKMPVIAQTVLKESTGKKYKGELLSLDYLFKFLDAYDFAGDGGEEIQEENKTLINASVLGLIFEKINGYKDGSFFTPGFITMYMSRETIRRAVVQKFNDVKKWNCQNLDEVYNKIDDRSEANLIINSLKICDLAVGSGHFLVSALNEMISVKNDLNILQDTHGRRLKEYNVEVVNDELVMTDEDGELFEYNPKNPESQRIQQTLFHEKQTIIENCLFGVDINPNSVKICRLRLWIELLKNAYYKNEHELETLPNIDINIKVGNSLISRYALDADIKKALSKSQWSIESYRLAVMTYRNATGKEEKREMQKLITSIKNDFESEVAANDKRVLQLRKLNGELFTLTNQTSLFERSKKELADWNRKIKVLTGKIQKLETELEEIKNNKIYENAFEWRFEFPEVLNDDGDYVGFDVVIGNPPYIRQEEFSEIKPYLQNSFDVYSGTSDLYTYFVEMGMEILKKKGEFIFILPNKWMRAGYGKGLRKFVSNFTIRQIIDFGDLPVFDEATTYPCILHILKDKPVDKFTAVNVDTLDYPDGIANYLTGRKIEVLTGELQDNGWTLTDSRIQKLLAKLKSKGTPLGEYVDGKIFRGVLTGLNEAFVIDEATRERLIVEDPKSVEIIKPFLAGRDIKRYRKPATDKYLIFTRRGIDVEKYPAILNHLHKFREQLEPSPKDFNGKNWPGRKPGTYKWYEIQDSIDYFKEFQKPKILWPGITSVINSFSFDDSNNFGNDNVHMIMNAEKSLLGLLNSKISKFYLSNIADFVRGGFIRLKISYVSEIPIRSALDEQKQKIEDLVNSILIDPSQIALEAEIDRLVYALYGLTDEEVRIVEESIG